MAGTAADHHHPRRHRMPDLVLDSKMETSKVGRGCIQHTLLKPPVVRGDRALEVKQTWRRTSTVVSDRIFLDKCTSTAEVRAVKVLNAHLVYADLDHVRELEALAKFSGLKYAHCFVNSDGWYELDGDVVVSMEYLPLGHLGRYLAKPLLEAGARGIVKQLLKGLRYMHKAGFVHRNLMPENIMVKAINPSWVVKIGGFGCVTRDPSDVTTGCPQNRLSEAYSAPELLRLTKARADVAYAVDMWSLGAVTFRLLTGATPFDDQGGSRGKHSLKRGRRDLQIWKLYEQGVSEPARDFILALMEPEAGDRLSAAKAAAHRWIKPGPSLRAGGGHAGCETCSETLIGHDNGSSSSSSSSTPVQQGRSGPVAALLAIKKRLETDVQPQCAAFTGTSQEYARLNHALEQLQLDVDGVPGRGEDEAARALGKRLVDTAQFELGRLDEALRCGGRRWWDCSSCGRSVRFRKGARDGTFEVDRGERTNMVVVADPLYFCKCQKDAVCLKCGVVEAEVCKCYKKGDWRSRHGKRRA
ncbi:uncharacterized protein PpBr36_10794 [Pyricularia pennisetigena]|uniref:uncharacterized protein n=1 Tax=Pyricularia pennisetigena TaxID=1578925 RepID=UPI00114D6EC7|nr:uncharacterized protein PpBr36_10794 [Pyricularia pennisetigena]TLS20951.1 hypothetical protein PpBr36_10794 [Pyricularia pennisetigena]